MKKNFKIPYGTGSNEIEILKDQIVGLKCRNIVGQECHLTNDRTFTVTKISGCFVVKCRLGFKCVPKFGVIHEDISAEVKLNCFEYLRIKHFKKELWINDRDFQIKTFIALFSALIGAAASFITCKICA